MPRRPAFPAAARAWGEEKLPMKTFVVFLCLITTTANATPVYLKCHGKLYEGRESEPKMLSIKIDGANVAVTVENNLPRVDHPVSVPVRDDNDNEDILAFGGSVPKGEEEEAEVSGVYGKIDRITGHSSITFFPVGGNPLMRIFEGECRKTEKLF
jgi:hypothetical protein